jgi:glycosyltransferase involved in cell wall biosynthesis
MENLKNSFALIAFASYWGSKFGGINAFNTDFLEAMSLAYSGKIDVICIVTEAEKQDVIDAKNNNITLISLPYKPEESQLSEKHAEAAIGEIVKNGFQLGDKDIIWLGHDRISGQAALTAAQKMKGRSALIHHMSYDLYETFAENSISADDKTEQQRKLFSQADISIAVGPVLLKSLEDLIDNEASMIIPGLADITPRNKLPNTFSMFVSGRLSPDAVKLKQGLLSVAAFASSYKKAREQEYPEALASRPKLLLRGVNFEVDSALDEHPTATEANLKKFAKRYDNASINLKALPFTTDRERLFNDLKSASVAVMPSWHEGFGLVAWEAIAAGVPLILSKESGVYQLIESNHVGFEKGFIWPINVEGDFEEPYFSEQDLVAVSSAIDEIARDPSKARDKAIRLKEELAQYTWSSCAEKVAEIFDWKLSKGTIPEHQSSVKLSQVSSTNVSSIVDLQKNISVSNKENIIGLSIAQAAWDPIQGMAVSVLLRANEAIIPFDTNRQAELDSLVTWATTTDYPISTRLITGEGGIGKTRLALEFCAQLAMPNDTWQVGFLQKDSLKTLEKTWQQLLLNSKSTLIVIDYAETRTDELFRLLTLALKSPRKEKLCILLLARDSGEWWLDLPGKNKLTEALLFGRATTGPYLLSPLYDTENKKQSAYQNSLEKFSQLLQVEKPVIHPDLNGEHFIKPLYIQMAALLALYGEQPKSADGITRAIINHEQRYWLSALNNDVKGNNHVEKYDVTVARNLLALVTLSGNFPTVKEAKKCWQAINHTDISQTEFTHIFNRLSPLYPGYQGLQSVKPDLLGEELVAMVLLTPIGPTLLSTVLEKAASGKTRHNAMTVLARLSLYKPALHSIIEQCFVKHLPALVDDIVVISVAEKSCLPEITIAAIRQLKLKNINSVASLFSTRITANSLALNSLRCESHKIIFAKSELKAQKKPKSDGLKAKLGSAAFFYANSLIDTGQYMLGLDYAKKANDIFLLLNQKNPEEYQQGYSHTLSIYSSALSNVGREEAIEYAKIALDIDKKLASDNPENNNNYSISLINYSNRLSSLGHSGEAIFYGEEALRINKELPSNDSENKRANRALFFSNCASYRADLGEYEIAIRYSKQALDIRYQLMTENLDRFQADYMTSLGNHAGHLFDLAQVVDSIDFANQSLQLSQELAEQNPERYNSDFANSLLTNSACLSYFAQYEKSLVYSKQALDIYRELYAVNPRRYQGELAGSLSNYSAYLADVGEYSVAIKTKLESIELLNFLHQEMPKKYALSLGNAFLSYQSLTWLTGVNMTTMAINLDGLLEDIPDFNHLTYSFFKNFVKATTEVYEEKRRAVFIKILKEYKDTPVSQKNQNEEYWYCASLWIFNDEEKSNDKVALLEGWLDKWQAYKERRKGHIPQWMLDIAIKWQLTWP